jgi:hypothetical protein
MSSIDERLYPEILALGTLVAAVQVCSVQNEIDLGRVYSRYDSGVGATHTATVESSRGELSIDLAKEVRAFHLGIFERRFVWAEGRSGELEEIVKAMAAWQSGMLVEDFAAAFPFMVPNHLAQGRQEGNMVPAQWDWLRNSDVFIDSHQMVERAYSDGRFAELFPVLTHGTLRLIKNYWADASREIMITPLTAGSFLVEDTSAADGGARADSVEQALQVAFEYLNSA